MPLTPEDIVRKEFREALRGYNQSDVDLFLDEVVEEFVRLTEDNQKMKVKIAALQQEVSRSRAMRTAGQAAYSGGAPGGASAAEAARLEGEIRSRVRRLLEEQLRLLDATEPRGETSAPASPTERTTGYGAASRDTGSTGGAQAGSPSEPGRPSFPTDRFPPRDDRPVASPPREGLPPTAEPSRDRPDDASSEPFWAGE